MTESSIIIPIDRERQERVTAYTRDLIRFAGKLYKARYKPVDVAYDLKGRAAGMYRVQNDRRTIRYNPYLFAKYYEDNLANTVPHEVAHYIADMLYGTRRVRPHGAEWQQVMRSLGTEPLVTGSYDLTGIPVRRQRRHPYQCNCRTHQISSVRHNKIHEGKASYYCRYCKSKLVAKPGGQVSD